MQTAKNRGVALFIAMMIIAPGQVAFAGSQVATPSGQFTTTPTAPGSKLFATITIIYKIDETSGCAGDMVADSFVMRVQQGNVLRPFSDIFGEEVCGLENFAAQQAAIEEFFNDVVIPAFFCSGQPCTLRGALKSVEQFVDGTDINDFTGVPFAMMNVVIAVK
jgi:hypothetical protein